MERVRSSGGDRDAMLTPLRGIAALAAHPPCADDIIRNHGSAMISELLLFVRNEDDELLAPMLAALRQLSAKEVGAPPPPEAQRSALLAPAARSHLPTATAGEPLGDDARRHHPAAAAAPAVRQRPGEAAGLPRGWRTQQSGATLP